MAVESEAVTTDKASQPSSSSRLARWMIRLGLVVAILGWLWPIGAGGMMPVGGDVTQFSIGLMAFLSDSLRHGHWPLWNDLWGFGFPGLAESQMGVYYPIHWGYALLSAESAYSTSLVVHFLWGGLGAAWMARRFGVSEIGSALTGFVWVTSGFFLIHLPHQWAYTVGSWMPWAWGLAWQTVRAREDHERPALLLAIVLAVQMLPGHFQLAFVTQVSILPFLLCGAGRGRWRGAVALLLALALAMFLAAAQLWPTLKLSKLAGSDRGFEYLSGFAATPLHLVSYLAPGLWHRSPLWRPIAWDLFHTAPEEYLGYVGLVPLWLALLALWGQTRSRPEVRALAMVGLLSLILSLGPYVPGFRWLITFPGFSFFRAPARWSLATGLALATLAGFGFDQVRRLGTTRRSVIGFGSMATLAVGLVIGGFELALAASQGGDLSTVATGFDRVLQVFPWADQPGEKSFRAAIAEAYRPQADLRVQVTQARLDPRSFPPNGMSLARERWSIYQAELTGSAVILVGLVAVGAILARRPRRLAWALGLLTLADATFHGRFRPFDLGPIRSLIAQSPVLQRVQSAGRGTRTLDPAQNLFQVAGAQSVTAYRTLTLPSPAWLTNARNLDGTDPQAAAALQILGVGARVLDPFESRSVPPDWNVGGWGKSGELIDDPALAGWLYGTDFARRNQVRQFRWIESAEPPVRAWQVEIEDASSPMGPTEINDFARAAPLVSRSSSPEDIEIECVSGPFPPWVVVSTTYDDEWSGTWTSPSRQTHEGSANPLPGGLQTWLVPRAEPGRWTLHLLYKGSAAKEGLMISAVAAVGWVCLGYWRWVGSRRRDRTQTKLDESL